MYIYKCINIYVYVYIRICIHIYIHIQIHIHLCVYIHAYTQTHIYKSSPHLSIPSGEGHVMLLCAHGNTLQHSAIHCNTLQHTATLCNMQLTAPQSNAYRLLFYCFVHTATHCNTLQHTATHCNTLQHTATQSNAYRLLFCAHCNTLQHTQHSATRALWQLLHPPCLSLARMLVSTFRHRVALQHSSAHCSTYCST